MGPSRLALVAAVLLVAGCSTTPAPPANPAPGTGSLTVTSTDFREGATIPAGFTCTGGGHRPALTWTGGTAAAWAVVVDDPDAPGGDFYHWVVADLPGATTSVAGTLPAGAVELENSDGTAGWTPPCPPSGTHHYRFTVYALKTPTGLSPGTARTDAVDRITRSATAQGRLTGLVSHAG